MHLRLHDLLILVFREHMVIEHAIHQRISPVFASILAPDFESMNSSTASP